MTRRTRIATLAAPLALAAVLPAHAQEVIETVKLTIRGGPHAGTHQLLRAG